MVFVSVKQCVLTISIYGEFKVWIYLKFKHGNSGQCTFVQTKILKLSYLDNDLSKKYYALIRPIFNLSQILQRFG